MRTSLKKLTKRQHFLDDSEFEMNDDKSITERENLGLNVSPYSVEK